MKCTREISAALENRAEERKHAWRFSFSCFFLPFFLFAAVPLLVSQVRIGGNEEEKRGNEDFSLLLLLLRCGNNKTT